MIAISLSNESLKVIAGPFDRSTLAVRALIQPNCDNLATSKLGDADANIREKSALRKSATSRTLQPGKRRSYMDSSPSLKINIFELGCSGVKIALLFPKINLGKSNRALK